MNKQELFERISHLPSDCSGPSPMINKLAVLEFIKSLNEPQKVTVPQFVADWIEVCKEHLTSSLYLAMTVSFLKANNQSFELILWIKKKENQDAFALAWINGYEVKKEKRYLVKMKGMASNFRFLKYNLITENCYMGNDGEICHARLYHTRKELEEAGFGEVFDSPLFEVEEVEG
jgi:hypothetical protein